MSFSLLQNRWVFGGLVFVVGVFFGAVLSGCPATEQAPVRVEVVADEVLAPTSTSDVAAHAGTPSATDVATPTATETPAATEAPVTQPAH